MAKKWLLFEIFVNQIKEHFLVAQVAYHQSVLSKSPPIQTTYN